jgi:hypothetical protein
MDAALKASTATRRTKAGPIPGHRTPWLDRAENIEDFHRAINACRRYKVALATDEGASGEARRRVLGKLRPSPGATAAPSGVGHS